MPILGRVDALRNLLGWPEEVPQRTLEAHLDSAERDLQRRTGQEAPTEAQALDWEDALCWLAAASALPVLNTFALSGAAKVGRLEGSVEWKFLTPEEVNDLIQRYEQRAVDLIANWGDAQTGGGAGLWMEAI